MLAAPAVNAASFIGPGNGVTLDATSFDPNNLFRWTVITNATEGDSLSGLESTIDYALLAVGGGGTTFDIGYRLDNTSTGEGSQSSIAVFGFDITPLSGLDVLSGDFVEGSGGNFNGVGKLDFCLYQGSNCNGGATDGVFVDDAPEVGSFRLTYSSAQSSIHLYNFGTRWQRTGLFAEDSASGIGTPMTPVPEPATWAMMIAGFGLVGAALRRRRFPRPLRVRSLTFS